jgi:hypothetical protein
MRFALGMEEEILYFVAFENLRQQNKDWNIKPDSLKRRNAQIKKGNDIFVKYFTT